MSGRWWPIFRQIIQTLSIVNHFPFGNQNVGPLAIPQPSLLICVCCHGYKHSCTFHPKGWIVYLVSHWQPLGTPFKVFVLHSLIFITSFPDNISLNEYQNVILWLNIYVGLWCLKPLSTIFQLYRGGQLLN